MKKYRWYIKLASWEYWPMWVLYVPVFFQHIFLAIKAGNMFFFLKTNPAIDDGFILSDSKYGTLGLVPDGLKPKTIFVPKNVTIETLMNQMKQSGIHFPIIFKPDIGFRGLLVHKIDTEAQLKRILSQVKVNHIIQEYVDEPLEIGIFYYRFPKDKSGAIPSITVKEFLTIKGDGIHQFSQLVEANQRAFLQYDKLKVNFAHVWNKVLADNEEILVEAIGNHNRGTKFINACYLYDEELQGVFDALNYQMKGFYFGRFDIRTKSIQHLKNNDFKILEVNGVGAEPTHVYDPDYKLVKAWKEMLFLWRVIYKIAVQNKIEGEEFPKYNEAKQRWTFYRNYKKIAFAR